jgi:hypothetical protein
MHKHKKKNDKKSKTGIYVFCHGNNWAAFIVLLYERKQWRRRWQWLTIISDIKTHCTCSKKKAFSGAQNIKKEKRYSSKISEYSCVAKRKNGKK